MRSRVLLVSGYVLVGLLGFANVQLAADCENGCGAGPSVSTRGYLCGGEPDFPICKERTCQWGTEYPCGGNFEFKRMCDGWFLDCDPLP
jgi:hypothetical protein